MFRFTSSSPRSIIAVEMNVIPVRALLKTKFRNRKNYLVKYGVKLSARS